MRKSCIYAILFTLMAQVGIERRPTLEFQHRSEPVAAYIADAPLNPTFLPARPHVAKFGLVQIVGTKADERILLLPFASLQHLLYSNFPSSSKFCGLRNIEAQFSTGQW